MLFSKKPNQDKLRSVAKFYLALNEGSWPHFIQCVERFIEVSSLELKEFSINFQSNTPYNLSQFKKRAINFDVNKVESLRLESLDGGLGIYLNSEFKYLNVDGVYELNFVTLNTGIELENMFLKISNELCDICNVLYGYGRELNEKLDPTTENKIKTSLFGNKSVTIDKAVDVWMESPKEIMEGSAKGIYQHNLISNKKLDRGIFRYLKESMLLDTKMVKSNLSLVTISVNGLDAVKANYKDVCSFIRS